MSDNQKKTIIITGCARGIGRGLTTYFLEKGFRVVGIDVDENRSEELKEEVRNVDDFLYFKGSVADENFIEAVYQQLNALQVVGLVNNAGVSSAFSGPIEELSLEIWEEYLKVNLTGAMLNIKYAVPHLRKSKGTIVNITSTRAFQSEPQSESYAATKAGLIGLTHAAAISLGPDIRVNAIAPGWIDVTRHQGSESEPYEFRPQDISQHPVGRVGEPIDIAHAVDYLISEKSRFMTGQVLTLDGGMTRKMIYEH